MSDLASLIRVDRINVVHDDPKVLAYVSIRIADAFVLTDIRLIQAAAKVFVSFPSIPSRVVCLSCRRSVYHSADYCAKCGQRLRYDGLPRSEAGREIRYRDSFHPIDAPSREFIEEIVIDAYLKAIEVAHQEIAT